MMVNVLKYAYRPHVHSALCLTLSVGISGITSETSFKIFTGVDEPLAEKL